MRGKENKYLIKWASVRNDGDYDYGVEVVTPYELRRILELQKSTIFIGGCEERPINKCIREYRV